MRRTANLHTGGTIHDVTPVLHPELADGVRDGEPGARHPGHRARPAGAGAGAARSTCSSRPTSGPGLANHEPQPTAERFVDLLFPGTSALPRLWTPGGTSAPVGPD